MWSLVYLLIRTLVAAWVTQQARNLALDLDARASPVRFFVRDRDAKFSVPFDTVLRSEGIRVVRTRIQAPNANASAERVIETIRVECPGWTLVLGRRHLDRTLRTHADHYNRQRPHRVLGLTSPLATAGGPIPANPRDVRRRFCSAGSSTSTTASSRDRIRVSDPHAVVKRSHIHLRPPGRQGF
jgi:hypothetical protein